MTSFEVIAAKDLVINITSLALWGGASLTIVGVLGLVARPLNVIKRTIKEEIKRNKYQDEQIKDSLEQRQIMIASLLAVLEGLIQQGCNHNVTEQHKILNDYLNNRPFRCDWYRDKHREK